MRIILTIVRGGPIRPTRHKFKLVLLAGLSVVLLAGCGNDSGAPKDAGQGDDSVDNQSAANEARQSVFLKSAIEQVIVPGYTQMAEATATLVDRAQTFCDQRNQTGFEQVGSQWRAAMARWQAMRWLAHGPVRFAHRFDRIEGWPRATAAAVKTRVDMLIAQAGSPTAQPMTLALIEQQPIQAQGFPALEYLLFGPAKLADFTTEPGADRRCEMLVAVARNLASMSLALRNEWNGTQTEGVPDEFGRGLLGSRTEPILTMFNVLANQMRGSLAEVRREKLGGPLGLTGTESAPSPNVLNLQSSRSETSLDHVRGSLAAIEQLFQRDAGNFAGLLEDSDQALALARFAQSFEAARAQAQRLHDDGISLTQAFSTPALVDRAVQLYEAVKALDEIWLDPVMPAAGATPSFNFNDGD